MRHARVDSSRSSAMHLVPFSSMYSEPVLPPPKYAQMIPAHVNKYGINNRESVMAGRPGKTRVVPAHQGNKTIGDEGITVDFRFIKVHTPN